MKINKIVFLFSVVVFTFFIARSQENAKKDLNTMAIKMFEKTNERDFDALLDMTYPKVYDLVPKETMKNLFVSMFEGTDEMSINLPNLTPKYILSDIYSDEDSNTEYAFLTYDMSMSMTFKQQDFDKDGKQMMIKMFKVQGMDASFETDNKINILAPNRMVVFLKNESSNKEWKMINYDSNSPIFVDMLSVGILEKAGKYYQNILLEAKKRN